VAALFVPITACLRTSTSTDQIIGKPLLGQRPFYFDKVPSLSKSFQELSIAKRSLWYTVAGQICEELAGNLLPTRFKDGATYCDLLAQGILFHS
jgi:hypothetical protein